MLGKAVLLHHPRSDAVTSLTVDASNKAIGGQLEQRHGRLWVPIAFFSRKLSEAEQKYSAFDRELLASYAAVKHFRHFLEGRPFTIFTDHKPLTTVLSSHIDCSPRQTRHLSFISEFIRHIKGKFNVVADALSRINSVGKDDQHKECINFEKLARAQEASDEMASYHTATTGLVLKDIETGPSTLLCDISMGKSRPVLPISWTRSILNKIHGLSHSGVKPTQKAISQRFV
ncbi:Pol polyprotein [Elysia marginata]|uniref:Pol polyprotein n=1 Tax=Elysia marginata TaxID=1093978 RepID=A0AAV4F2H8_9GAST|nr:Pol polyprotein [Elysia marginata]